MESNPTGPGCWSVTATAREHALRNLAAAEAAEAEAAGVLVRMAELWLRTAEHDETRAEDEGWPPPEYEVRTAREPSCRRVTLPGAPA
jgi:uncharacterized protein (DUF2342 family)